MKYTFYIFFFLFCAATTVTAQTVSQVRSQSTDPTYTPSGAVTAPPLCYNRTTHHLWGYAGGYWYDLTGGTYVDLDPSPTNEKIVSFSVVAGVLRINENGIFYNVPINDIIAAANISSASPTITVTNVAGVVTVTSTDPDESVTNELQNLNLAGQTLSISNGNNVALPVVGVTAGLGIGTSTVAGVTTVTNTSPDQTVILNGGGATTVTGTYPNFTVTTPLSLDNDPTNECNTSVTVNTGNLEITDPCGTQSVAVTNIAPVQAIAAGTGISTSVAGGTVTITNTDPDQTVTLTGSGINTVTGTYPNFTVTATEVDGSITNECNTAFALTVDSLKITDNCGTLGVPLSAFGTPTFADNGLEMAGDTVHLGGALIENTFVVGAMDKTMILAITDTVNTINKVDLSSAGVQLKSEGSPSTSEVTLNVGDLLLRGETAVKIVTPNTPASPNGSVLTLIDNLTGEAEWQPAAAQDTSFWRLTGNAGTTAGTNFVGTTDAQDLVLKTNGVEIASYGQQGNATIGSDLTAIDPSYTLPIATGVGAIAMQAGQATGEYSKAWGIGNIVSGYLSNSWGLNNSVTGDQCTAFGIYDTLTNQWGTAWGLFNNVSGAGGTAWGQLNQLTGYFSTAWGIGNTASAEKATAWGATNVAGGDNSTSWGNNNIANGRNSTSFGHFTTSPSYAETTIGTSTTLYTPIDSISYNAADRLFTIGNGINTAARNNALTLWKDGRSMWNGDVAKQNTWIGVNGTNAQNFINVTTPTGAIAAISTEHTTSGNYAVLGSNAGNSGLTINNTKQFAFTTTAGTTSTALGATTTIANYGNTGFLFGGGGTAAANLHLAGSEACDYTTIAATTTLLPTNRMVYVNNGATNITITIPAGDKLLYTITRLDNTSTGTITVQLAGGTIQDVGGTIGATTSISAVSGQRSETFHVTGTVARRTTNQ